LSNTVQVDVIHLRHTPPAREAEARTLVEERPLIIDVSGMDQFTIMRTPGMDRALSVGFLFSEGIIDGLADIGGLEECRDNPDLIRISLAAERRTAARRNLVVNSSCGLCGRMHIAELVKSLGPVRGGVQIASELLFGVSGAMRQQQALFKATGSTHAAALFDSAGAIAVVGEDIGRHNAVDKVLGQALLTRLDPAGMALFLSGRASLELIIKAARAKVGLVAAVSAPSAQAVETARQLGMTLCGFVRGDEATVYTHDWRVK
jgi:FdhD protein